MEIERLITSPIRKNKDPDTLWRKADKGLINAWELGRQMAEKNNDLSKRALEGELPVLMFKGGFDERLKSGVLKYGTLHYFAMWKGLRSEHLLISLESETGLICSRTGMGVLFTFKSSKYLLQDMTKSDQAFLGDRFCDQAKNFNG
jgi:hypothetical protein